MATRRIPTQKTKRLEYPALQSIAAARRSLPEPLRTAIRETLREPLDDALHRLSMTRDAVMRGVDPEEGVYELLKDLEELKRQLMKADATLAGWLRRAA